MVEKLMKDLVEDNIGSSKDLAFKIASVAEDKKAIDTRIIDVRSVTDVSDYLIITGGDNPAQLKAIAGYIDDSLSKDGLEPSHREGKYGDKWFLFDYGDVIIHIIENEARDFYKLEEFWSHAMEVPAEEWQQD